MSYRFIPLYLTLLPFYFFSPPSNASSNDADKKFLKTGISPLNVNSLSEELSKTPSPQRYLLPKTFQNKLNQSSSLEKPNNHSFSPNPPTARSKAIPIKKPTKHFYSSSSEDEPLDASPSSASTSEKNEPLKKNDTLEDLKKYESEKRTKNKTVLFSSREKIQKTLMAIHEQQIGLPEKVDNFIEKACRGAKTIFSLLLDKFDYSKKTNGELLATIQDIEAYLYAFALNRTVKKSGPYEVDFQLIGCPLLEEFFEHYYIKNKNPLLPSSFVSERGKKDNPDDYGCYDGFTIHHIQNESQSVRDRNLGRFGGLYVGYTKNGNLFLSLVRTGNLNCLQKIWYNDPYPYTTNTEKTLGHLSKALPECIYFGLRYTLPKKLCSASLSIKEIYHTLVKDYGNEEVKQFREKLLETQYNLPACRTGGEIIASYFELLFSSYVFADPDCFEKAEIPSRIYARALFNKLLKINKGLAELGRLKCWSAPSITNTVTYEKTIASIRDFITSAEKALPHLNVPPLQPYLKRTIIFLKTLPLFEKTDNKTPREEFLGPLFDPLYQEQKLRQKMGDYTVQEIAPWLKEKLKEIAPFQSLVSKDQEIPETSPIFCKKALETKGIKNQSLENNNPIDTAAINANKLLYPPVKNTIDSPCFYSNITDLHNIFKSYTKETLNLANEATILGKKIATITLVFAQWRQNPDTEKIINFSNLLATIASSWTNKKKLLLSYYETYGFYHPYLEKTKKLLNKAYSSTIKYRPSKLSEEAAQQQLKAAKKEIGKKIFLYFYADPLYQAYIKAFSAALEKKW